LQVSEVAGEVAEPSAERLAAVQVAAAGLVDRVLDLTLRIAAVPSPTGHEGARSRLVADLFREDGLPVTVDPIGDVVAIMAGAGGDHVRPPVLLAAHLDTVFADGTPLPVRREGDRLIGPGIGDNSLGVAAVLLLPALLRAAGTLPAVDLLLTGNVGEEGLGNLRGIRSVMDANPRVGAVVAVEGHNLGRVTHIAVGSRRLRVEARGPGGHSWGDFGRPNAIHTLARLIAALDELSLPRSPKTTLNVGKIEGGVSVNSIAPSASCLLDLRSVDAGALRQLSERVDRVIAQANRDGVAVTAEVLGERPAGVIPLDRPIVRLAAATLSALGVEPAYDASSTDANVAINRGVPAVCIGLTTGVNVHREDEAIDIAPIASGLSQLALLTLGLADRLASEETRAGPPSRRRT
jgi:acetylornithine deacetylase/succinyl-diaminopimelate desuccinylase-like protein